MLPVDAREDLIKRLRRIEGQTQGIQRMLADGRDCPEVLYQLASVRSATRSVAMELMKHHLASSLHELAGPESERAISDMLSLILRA